MKIPVTLITGYLGAGKTTLLRHIVDNLEGRKYAILMNEFGTIDIDSRVVQSKNVAMIELKGGCVCCSLTGEFEAAIAEIREQVKPELIIIETTGVAEPDAIINDLGSIQGVRLDAVVTVVDARALADYPSVGHTGRMQIESADVILLNKTDLVRENSIEGIEKKLALINSHATIHRTSRCDVGLEMILDVNFERTVERKAHGHAIPMDSIVYESDGKLSKNGLEKMLSTLPMDVQRAKGFVRTDGGRFLVNMVFGRVDFEDFDADRTELVFIGKDIRRHEKSILENLRKCRI